MPVIQHGQKRFRHSFALPFTILIVGIIASIALIAIASANIHELSNPVQLGSSTSGIGTSAPVEWHPPMLPIATELPTPIISDGVNK